MEYEITVLEERLKQMTPNMAAIEEYKRKVCVYTTPHTHTHTTPHTHTHTTQDKLHQARLVELDTVTGERDICRGEFEDLRKQRLDQFMSGFSIITNKLKEMYQVSGGKWEGIQW